MKGVPVAVVMVTYESAADLPRGLAAVGRLDPAPAELVVVDCASTDGSAAVARASAPPGIRAQFLPLAENVGFAAGMNRAVALATAPYLLTLNADTELSPDFLAPLVARLESPHGRRFAAVTGRLLRERSDVPGDTEPRRLDACGMRLSWTWRHFDRGSGEADRGQFSAAELVFGATGAATLWRRAALADVALEEPHGPQIFDERYHSFREDAELAFRLRERDWEIVYEPLAVATHRRRVLPERRAALPAAVNLHSLKNRYLLRLDHQTAGNFLWTLPATLLRDAAALAWVLLRERSSLPAYGWLWRNRRELVAHRRRVQRRRTAPARAVGRWFLRVGAPLPTGSTSTDNLRPVTPELR
ncbi:MAG: glycosyltransferase [Thermoanaerobaculia bacterium]